MNWKVQPPVALRALFPGATWRMNKNEKEIYLTFDDGPVEKETTWVMNLLESYGIIATFFCVGENAQRNPGLVKELLASGHSVGNHTYNHLPAWKCDRDTFFENIEKGRPFIPGNLFRPPHGQLYPWYMAALQKQFDQIIMWDVLTMDYDNRLTKEEVLNNAIQGARNGSILVFHDSKKAWDRLQYALPATLDHLMDQGYQFKTIQM